MDDLSLIETEKSALFEHLSSTFTAGSIKAVAELAPTFCKVLSEQLVARLLKHCARVFPGSAAHPRRKQAIEFQGREYRVQFTTEPLTQRDKLPFVVSEVGGDSPPSLIPKSRIIPLTSISQYKAIEFCVDESLPVNENFLDNLSRGLFSAGYQWLSNKLTTAVRIDTAKIATGLYDYMRAMLAERLDILDGFIFSCLLDKDDFVILDECAAEGALRLADKGAQRYQTSREAVVLQVMGEIVNINDSVIIDACSIEDQSMSIALSPDSKYYRDSQEFFDSMAALWGKEVTCFPIIKSGPLRVVAFYPSAVAYEITPIVGLHAPTLARMATEQSSLIRQHLKVLEDVLSPVSGDGLIKKGKWVAIGEIIGVIGGTFTGRAIKNMSE